MTIENFNDVNKLFKSLVDNTDLENTKSLIDNESILSRVYKKVDNKIESDILGCLLIFNKHIVDEQYESAEKMKQYIMNNY